MNICIDAFCGEPNQNQLRILRKGEQYNGAVRDILQGIDHPTIFWLVEIGEWAKQKLYWVDISTWQIYDPVTGYIQSGDYLKLKGHPKLSNKKLRVIRKNHLASKMMEIDDAESD